MGKAEECINDIDVFFEKLNTIDERDSNYPSKEIIEKAFYRRGRGYQKKALDGLSKKEEVNKYKTYELFNNACANFTNVDFRGKNTEITSEFDVSINYIQHLDIEKNLPTYCTLCRNQRELVERNLFSDLFKIETNPVTKFLCEICYEKLDKYEKNFYFNVYSVYYNSYNGDEMTFEENKFILYYTMALFTFKNFILKDFLGLELKKTSLGKTTTNPGKTFQTIRDLLLYEDQNIEKLPNIYLFVSTGIDDIDSNYKVLIDFLKKSHFIFIPKQNLNVDWIYTKINDFNICCQLSMETYDQDSWPKEFEVDMISDVFKIPKRNSGWPPFLFSYLNTYIPPPSNDIEIEMNYGDNDDLYQ
jgi:hypothetical protein